MSKRNKTQKNTPFNSKQGGVMIISEDAACKGTISAGTHGKEAMSLYEQTRFVRCAVPFVIDSKICFLHASSLHNLPEHTALAKQAKERNHADILADASKLGEQAVFLCMDTNSSSSAILEAAIKTGRWVDVGQQFGEELTFCNDRKWDKFEHISGATRPDRILANRPAWTLVKGFEIVRNSTFRGHLPLKITLNAKKIAQVQFVPAVPRAYPTGLIATNEDKMEDIAMQVLDERKHIWLQARMQKDVNQAWKEASKIGEIYLHRALKASGAHETGEKGRYNGHILKTQKTIAAAYKRNPESPSTLRISRIEEMRRKAMEIQTKMRKKKESTLVEGSTIRQLCTRIQKFILEMKLPCKQLAETNPPEEKHLTWFLNCTEAIVEKLENTDSKRRIDYWKKQLDRAIFVNSEAKTDDRKALKRIMHKDKPPPIAAIKTDKDKESAVLAGKKKIILDPQEIFKELAEDYAPLFNKDVTCTYDEFRAKFVEFIQKETCDLGPLKTTDLAKTIKGMNDKRAVALCGWRVIELKTLPLVILE